MRTSQPFTCSIVALVSMAFMSTQARAEQRSFNEVREAIYSEPLKELPFYSRFSVPAALKSILRFNTALLERAGLTVRDPSDLIDPAPKVLHPMGVCAEAEWKIDVDTAATGLLSQGTTVPAIVRLSVASNAVTPAPDSKRVIAIAVKLFPSTDPNAKVTSRNFLTADQTGLDGSTRHSFFFGDNPTEKIYFSNKAPGSGFAAKLGFVLFDRIDGPSNYRSVYALADVDHTNSPVARPISPVELRLVPRFAKKNPVPADFRDEIRAYGAGEMHFDVVIQKEDGLAESMKIGTMTLGSPVVSVACDQRLHFHHHPQNRKLNATQTTLKDMQMDGTEKPLPFRYHNGPRRESGQNRWEHTASAFKDNFLFHEVKYFNFASSTISGALTYIVPSPRTSKELILSGYFVEDGKVSVVRKAYDLTCVNASASSVNANICNEGKITEVSPGKIRVIQSSGPLKWDMVFDAPLSAQTHTIQEIEFNKTLPLKAEALAKNFKGWFHWVPTFRSSRVTGTVTFNGRSPRTVPVSADNGYHDQHWGIWNPSTQPMRWVHFTGLDSAQERIDLSLGEFPKNDDPRAGLALFRKGKKFFWQPGTYKVESLETGVIPVTHLNQRKQTQFVVKKVDPSFQSGNHQITKKFRIVTLLPPQLEAVIETTSAVAIHGGGNGRFILNEQISKVDIRFLEANGEALTAGGDGFYMETSSIK